MLPILRILALLLVALPCLGATFYVSTTGNDSTGDGSIGNPWLTIRKGTLTMAGGDTLNIRGGTYPDDGFDIEEIKSGPSAANPTIIQSFPGEYAAYVPNAGVGQNFHAIIISHGSNVFLNSFRISGVNCLSDVVKLDQGTTNVVCTNLYVHGCPRGMGILTTGDTEGVFMGSQILNCQIVTNGWNWQSGDSPLHQIYIQTSVMTVTGCYIQGATNDDGGTVGIHYFGSNSTNSTFARNYITNCVTGILAAATFGSNCWMYDNVIVNSYGYGISAQVMSSVFILNNTLYTNIGGINMDRTTNSSCENNIAVGGAANPASVYVQAGSNIFVRNNLGYGNFTGGGSRQFDYRTNGTPLNLTTNANLFGKTEEGTLDIYNAQFISIPTNLRINANSSAFGTGRTQTLFTTDFDGNPRSVPWDIGAFEFQLATAVLNGAILRGASISPP